MQLTVLGAAQTVTGSMHLVEAEGATFLLDCGLFQGRWEEQPRINRNFPFDPSSIDYVLLSHAHLDHCGRLPLLVKQGFKGSIYTTSATAELCTLLLRDYALQEEQEAALSRQRGGYSTPSRSSSTQGSKSSKRPVQPLFTEKDVERVARHFRPLDYNRKTTLPGDITIQLRDAGHILGSCMIEVWAEEEGKTQHLVFTGDVGRMGAPILRDPDFPRSATYLICESTYADHRHEPLDKSIRRLERLIIRAHRHSSKILVPAFAVGRTQTLIYALNEMVENAQVPIIPVYIDSPLAIRATDIFRRHPECFDEETWSLIRSGDAPLDFKGLRYVESQDESDIIAIRSGPAIIVAGSGMLNGGRILRHLYRQVENSKTLLLIIGFQAPGTLGHRIVNGARTIRLYGKSLRVRARVQVLSGFSAHTDRSELEKHLQRLRPHPPRQVFCVHGRPEACKALAGLVRRHLHCLVAVPSIGSRYRLT